MNRANFYEDVWDVARLIPPGRVTSYGAIAAYLGAKSSARMVGYAMNACATQPDVPAHRVLNRLGMLSGQHHFPPENSMADRLRAEGILVEDNAVVEFKQLFWDPAKEISL